MFLGEGLLVGLKPIDVSLVREDAYLMLFIQKEAAFLHIIALAYAIYFPVCHFSHNDVLG